MIINHQFTTTFILHNHPSLNWEYAPIVNQQRQQFDFPQLDSSLTVPVFKQGDDPIDAINHMMPFLSAVIISRYPTTNNQLRNSSNPRQQATINDRRVTLQPVQGRQISFAMSTTRTYTPGASRSNSGKERTVICYNCKGEGHIKEQVENRVVELYFVNTEYQLADIFTKALGRERIKFLINKLGMQNFTPETLKQLVDEAEE
ncbi:hypothetical protein Tco_0551562 [Tanacetum coccineum]